MNNDSPPACSPGLEEDGKQVFKLQWPKEAAHETTPTPKKERNVEKEERRKRERGWEKGSIVYHVGGGHGA